MCCRARAKSWRQFDRGRDFGVAIRDEADLWFRVTDMGNSGICAGRVLAVCALLGVRRLCYDLVPERGSDTELSPNSLGKSAPRLATSLLAEDLAERAAVSEDELGGLVHAQAASLDGELGFDGASVHELFPAPYGQETALSRARSMRCCQPPADGAFELGVAKTRGKTKRMAKGWSGFAGRLRYAVDERKLETPGLTQNDIANRAGIDTGQFAKILSGARARGATANTVLLLAEALDVEPVWLMKGVEPSGLSRQAPQQADTVPPPSSVTGQPAPTRKTGSES